MGDDKFIKPILTKRFPPRSFHCSIHPCSTTLSSGILKNPLLTLLYPTSTLNPLTVLCALNHPTKDRFMWATSKAPKTLKSSQVTLFKLRTQGWQCLDMCWRIQTWPSSRIGAQLQVFSSARKPDFRSQWVLQWVKWVPRKGSFKIECNFAFIKCLVHCLTG